MNIATRIYIVLSMLGACSTLFSMHTGLTNDQIIKQCESIAEQDISIIAMKVTIDSSTLVADVSLASSDSRSDKIKKNLKHNIEEYLLSVGKNDITVNVEG